MLILNEWRYILRQPLIWLCVSLPLVFAFVLANGIETIDTDSIKQFQLNLIALQMMSLPLLVGAMTPVAFLRDVNFEMRELVLVTRTNPLKRELSRVFSLFLLGVAITAASSLLLMLLSIQQGGLAKALIGLLFKNLATMTVPNIFLLTAVGYFIARKSASTVVTYMVFGSLWLGYLFLASISGSPILAGSSIVSETFYALFTYLDPFGFTAILAQLVEIHWQLNTPIFLNRGGTIALTALLLFVSFRQPVKSQSRESKCPLIEPMVNRSTNDNLLNLYKSVETDPVKLPVLFSLFKTALVNLLTNRVTLFIVLVWPIMVFNAVASGAGYLEPFSIVRETTRDALNQFAFDMLPLLGTLLMALWSWQVCTRDKAARMAELIAAAPVKNAHLLISQVLVLATMVVMLMLLCTLGSSVAHWFKGIPLDSSIYVQTLGLTCFPLFLLSIVFISLFHLCRTSVIAGVLIGLICLLKFTPVMTYFGLTHPLWNIAWTPLQPSNEFWGYRASLNSYWPYMRVWLIGITTLMLVATVYSFRGAGLSRQKVLRKHKILTLPVVLFIAAILALHSQLVSERPLFNSHLREAYKVAYEQTLAKWKEKVQPRVNHIEAAIDFFPHLQQAKISLNYTLVNHHHTPIEQLLVGRAGFYHWEEIELENAVQSQFFANLNQAVYTLKSPLQPGESLSLKTQFSFNQPRLWPIRGHHYITPEFSYLRGIPLIPTIGYQLNYEIHDANLRVHYGLPENRQPKPSVTFAEPAQRTGQHEWLTLTSTITTNEGYHALSQGKLVSQFNKHGRSHFIYRTETPINAIPAWLTMPFEPLSRQHGNVQLNIYSPLKNHAANINLQAMGDTLDWFTDNELNYRGSHLSLVAVPTDEMTGYALPQIALINLDVGFRALPSVKAGFDQRYRRAVHETAHQWFGHDIGNGVYDDRAFLVESLAKYIELVVIEKNYGEQAAAALVDYENERYRRAARHDITEKLALVDATNTHDQYSKATLIFAELRKTIGDEKIIAALKDLWQHHTFPNSPANAMDFVRSLKKATSQEDHPLIDTLFLTP